MKILFRPQLCSPVLAARLAGDPQLGKALGAEPNAAVGHLFKRFFDANGPLLAQVLAHAQAEGERLSFLRDLQFTPAQVAEAAHLEVICRKTIGQSDAESRTTLDDYAADPLHPTASRWPVRLPRCVYLGKAVPPQTMAHVDQYTGEYVLGAEAAAALRTAGLSGWQLQPVLHWKTKLPQPQLGMHLSSRELLPAALACSTTAQAEGAGSIHPGGPRRRGALSYAAGALVAAPDFARTAEPWCSHSVPGWIVSQRVRAWYERSALAGWAFWPVLEQGTALQREHEDKWAEALARLRAAGSDVAA